MTLTQYKKIIKALDRNTLEDHLFDLFKTSSVFKDIETSTWANDDSALIDSFKSKLEKVFWKNTFSISECKAVLKDYSSRTVREDTKALLNLYYAMEAVELSAAYGDFGESFYNSLEGCAEKFIKYCEGNEPVFREHEGEFEKMVKTADRLGYGVGDDLEDMLEETRLSFLD